MLFSTIVIAQTSSGYFKFEGKFNFQNSDEQVVAYDFSSDNKQFRLFGEETVKVWDVETKKVLESRKHGIKNLLPKTFGGYSPDKTKMLVLSYKNSPAKIYDIKTGKTLAVLDGVKNSIKSAMWSKDGSMLLTADNSLFDKSSVIYKSSTEVGFWNGETFELYNSANIKDIDWFYLTDDGRDFYSTSTPQDSFLFLPISGTTDVVNVRDTQTGKIDRKLSVGGTDYETISSKMMVSPNGEYLALVSKSKNSEEERVMVWETSNGKKPLYIITNPEIGNSKLLYSPDGKYFAVDSGKNLQIYELATGRMTAEFKNKNLPDFWLADGNIALFCDIKFFEAIDASDGSTEYRSVLFYLEREEEVTKSTKDAFGNYEKEVVTDLYDASKIQPSPNSDYFLSVSDTQVSVYHAKSGSQRILIRSPGVKEKKIKILGLFSHYKKVYPETTIKSVSWSEDSRTIIIEHKNEAAVSVYHLSD